MVLSSYLFKDKKLYWRKISLLGLFYSNTLLILILSKSQILFKTLCETFAFNLAIANFLLVLSLALANCKFRKLTIGLLGIIAFIPSGIFWAYYSIYGTAFSTDSLMAIMQTNTTETLEYISHYVNIYTIFLLIIGLISTYLVTIKCTASNNKTHKVFASLCVVFSIISGYTSFNNFLTGPVVDCYLIQKMYGNVIANKDKRQNIIKQNLIFNPNNKGIYILVIGESHNKLYTSAYGYPLDTTPWLKSMEHNPNFLLFQNAYSNYTQTVQTLSYSLTLKNQYNNIYQEDAPTLIEIAKAAGFKTVWLSNQGKFSIWDSAISIIANDVDESQWVNNTELRVHSTQDDSAASYDGKLIDSLKNVPLTDKMLIIIHLYGSHQTYKDRYPASFNKFTDTKDPEIRDYINSIYYNDYVMSEIVNYAKTMPYFQGLVYFSDHSEAVNHGGHSATNYRPDMVCIPMYMYFSNKYIKEYPQEFINLKEHRDATFTNDLITNTMLSIMQLQVKNYYEPENDLGNTQYNGDFQRFRTLHGKVPLTDWHTLTTD